MKSEDKAEHEEMEALELLRIEMTAPFGRMSQIEADLISDREPEPKN